MDKVITKGNYKALGEAILLEVQSGQIDDELLARMFRIILVGEWLCHTYGGTRIRDTGHYVVDQWSQMFAKEKIELTVELIDSTQQLITSATKIMDKIHSDTVAKIALYVEKKFMAMFEKYVEEKVAEGHQRSLKQQTVLTVE